MTLWHDPEALRKIAADVECWARVDHAWATTCIETLPGAEFALYRKGQERRRAAAQRRVEFAEKLNARADRLEADLLALPTALGILS